MAKRSMYTSKPKAKIDYILKVMEAKNKQTREMINKFAPKGNTEALHDLDVRDEVIKEIKENLKKTKPQITNKYDFGINSKIN